MRQDMAEVMKDARSGRSGKRSRETYKRKPWNDESPMTEHMGYKEQNRRSAPVRIGPLRDYLRSCVGKDWDSVYSELSRAFRGKMHGRKPMLRYVEWVMCMEPPIVGEDGKLYQYGWEMSTGDLYVDGDGILRTYVRKVVCPSLPPKKVTVVQDGKSFAVLYKGVWFLIRYSDEYRTVKQEYRAYRVVSLSTGETWLSSWRVLTEGYSNSEEVGYRDVKERVHSQVDTSVDDLLRVPTGWYPVFVKQMSKKEKREWGV